MEEEEEHGSRNHNMGEEEQLEDHNEENALRDFAGLSPEAMINLLSGTEGFDPALIEEFTKSGNFDEIMRTLTATSPEGAEVDEDGSATGYCDMNAVNDDTEGPSVPDTAQNSVQAPGPNSISIGCAEVEVVANTPAESPNSPGEPAFENGVTEETDNQEIGASPADAQNLFSDVNVKIEPRAEVPSTSAYARELMSEPVESEYPSPAQSSAHTKSKARDPDHDTDSDHHHEKKRKKHKHSRKHSTDSSESARRHKSKNKHKDKDRGDKHKDRSEKKKGDKEARAKEKEAKETIKNLVRKFNLKRAAILAVDINDIVLLKKHMVLRREKISKIEDIDKKKRVLACKKRHLQEAAFASTKEKPHKHDKKQHYEKKSEQGSSKKREAEKKSKKVETKRTKKVFRVSDGSESDSPAEKSNKHKKRQNSTSEREEKKRHKEKDKDREMYTATGARILPFEKRHKEQERIRRPKMPEVDPNAVKEEKRSGFQTDRSKKVMDLLQSAEDLKMKRMAEAKRIAATQFKIPKKPGEVKEELAHSSSSYQKQTYNPISAPAVPNIRFDKFKKFNYRDEPSRGSNRFENPNQFRPQNNCSQPQQPPRKIIRLETYDDDNNDMMDLPGSDDDEEIENAPPPITEVKESEVSNRVKKLLLSVDKALELLPCEHGLPSTEVIAAKVAWWFGTMEKDPLPANLFYVPEEEDNAPSSDDGSVSDCSSFGNVSNPENDDCQVHEISSSDQRARNDPDRRDEYCGAGLLSAKFRTSAAETFQNIFEVRPGTNYDRENFQAKCTICDDLIIGKRGLGVHVRSYEHREEFKLISLKEMTRPEKGGKDTAATEPSSSTPKPESSRQDRDKSSKDEGKARKSDGRDKKGRNGSKMGQESNGSGGNKPRPMDEIVERVSRSGTGPTHKALLKAGPPAKVVEEVDRVSRTGSGLSLRTPPVSMSSHRSHPKSRSPARRVPKSRSRSPIRRPRSPAPRPRRTRSRSLRKRYQRSRSPGYMRPGRRSNSRTRSPPRREPQPQERYAPIRSMSEERVAEFLAKTNRRRSRSPYDSRRGLKRKSRSRSNSPAVMSASSNRTRTPIFPEKLKLQAAGLWTDGLEQNWQRMEAEEAQITQDLQTYYRKTLANNPDQHPKYTMEWEAYWGRRYTEVQTTGGDADAYDYVPEWKELWAMRVEVLLAEELDEKVDAVRAKYGMDLSTLQRIQWGNPAPAQPGPALPQIQTPAPVPPPTGFGGLQPAPVPLPVAVVKNPESEVYSPYDEDCMARSMSLSSEGGLSRTQKNKNSAAMEPAKPVTVESFKDTWEQMTGQKISGSKSDAGSSRSGLTAELEFDGFDLVQILRLMTGLEDQLGILAAQVAAFFKQAEELELAKSKRSYELLEDQEFVVLLFQCRDKFNKLISANILSRDVMKTVNLTVYSLNIVLESEQCQKHRPTLTPTSSIKSGAGEHAAKPAPTNNFDQLTKRQPVDQAQNLPVPGPSSSGPVHTRRLMEAEESIRKKIRAGLKSVSLEKKIKIASAITSALSQQQLDCIRSTDLLHYVHEAVGPVMRLRHNEADARSSASSMTMTSSQLSTGSGRHRPPPPRRPILFPSSLFDLPDDRGATDEDGEERSAIPPLPTVQCRAGSPPAPSAATGRYVGIQQMPFMRASSSSSYGQSPARVTPDRRTPHPMTSDRRPPSRSHRKENWRPPLPAPQHKVKGRKEMPGVAQEFWNLDGSSLSSMSVCGSEEEETRPKSLNHGKQAVDKKSDRPVSDKSKNLRNQPKPRPEANGMNEVSEPESGEIVSDFESLSSVSFSRTNEEPEEEENDPNMKANLSELGRIREKISRRKRRQPSAERSQSCSLDPISESGSPEQPQDKESDAEELKRINGYGERKRHSRGRGHELESFNSRERRRSRRRDHEPELGSKSRTGSSRRGRSQRREHEPEQDNYEHDKRKASRRRYEGQRRSYSRDPDSDDPKGSARHHHRSRPNRKSRRSPESDGSEHADTEHASVHTSTSRSRPKRRRTRRAQERGSGSRRKSKGKKSSNHDESIQNSHKLRKKVQRSRKLDALIEKARRRERERSNQITSPNAQRTQIMAQAESMEIVSSPSASSVDSAAEEEMNPLVKPFPFPSNGFTVSPKEPKPKPTQGENAESISDKGELEDTPVLEVDEEGYATPCQDEVTSDNEVQCLVVDTTKKKVSNTPSV